MLPLVENVNKDLVWQCVKLCHHLASTIRHRNVAGLLMNTVGKTDDVQEWCQGSLHLNEGNNATPSF